jgi:hypothetical protein
VGVVIEQGTGRKVRGEGRVVTLRL